MKVKCHYKTGAHLPTDIGFNDGSLFPLELNKEYLVYAMTINKGYAWYYICDENFCYYPVWRPCPLFEVIDNRLSRYWVFTYKKGLNDTKANAVWAYREWAEDTDYYDKLTDGNIKEVDLFKFYKEKMSLEFCDPFTSEIAGIGDERWLICPNCIDAWESIDDRDALVKCPKCRAIFNNPRYKN